MVTQSLGSLVEKAYWLYANRDKEKEKQDGAKHRQDLIMAMQVIQGRN